MTRDQHTPALLPCPFCGGEAQIYLAFPDFEHGWHVDCEHDDSCLLRQAHGMFACEASGDAMAAAWNSRPAHSALVKALEAVAKDAGHVHLSDETWYEVQTALALARGGEVIMGNKPNLEKLLRESAAAFKAMPPEKQAAMRREQAISFVYGNLAIENDLITREMVEIAYDAR